VTREMKRGGKVWIRLFPDKPITRSRPKPGWEKARAIRRVGGGGEAGPDMFELEGIDEASARAALALASAKLPIR